MEKSDWERVEKALYGVFGSVELSVDGAVVSFLRVQIKNRLEIMTYVNGTLCGTWFSKKNNLPESAYLRERAKHIYTKKFRANVKVHKALNMKKSQIDEKCIYLTPFWTSVSTIRKQYESKFKSIKILKINGIGEEHELL